ncbi:hypothetical protein [Aliiroseovarius sp. YM-037]|uniref:hypothetical protein n=1 Tax=Aliiroseovarius sp. YM-037 TaxID=3341728 RepID=UPI003A80382B
MNTEIIRKYNDFFSLLKNVAWVIGLAALIPSALIYIWSDRTKEFVRYDDQIQLILRSEGTDYVLSSEGRNGQTGNTGSQSVNAVGVPGSTRTWKLQRVEPN